MERVAQIALSISIAAAVASMLAPPASARGRSHLPGSTTAWFVNAATGNDGNSCQSAAAACRTIGAAIAKSGGDDTITVAAGTYQENLGFGNINTLAIVGSGSGTTAIDGGGNAPVVTWLPSGDPQGALALAISAITIQNGGNSNAPGAGPEGRRQCAGISVVQSLHDRAHVEPRRVRPQQLWSEL
jgi:hypothetical protein